MRFWPYTRGSNYNFKLPYEIFQNLKTVAANKTKY